MQPAPVLIDSVFVPPGTYTGESEMVTMLREGWLHVHQAGGVKFPTTMPFNVTVRKLLAHSTPGEKENDAECKEFPAGVVSVHLKTTGAAAQLL